MSYRFYRLVAWFNLHSLVAFQKSWLVVLNPLLFFVYYCVYVVDFL